RLLAGDVQVERGNFDEAGKAFMSVALLYDDPAITPRALEKAASAYQRAGKPDEAGRASQQLHEKYPNQAAGGERKVASRKGRSRDGDWGQSPLPNVSEVAAVHRTAI